MDHISAANESEATPELNAKLESLNASLKEVRNLLENGASSPPAEFQESLSSLKEDFSCELSGVQTMIESLREEFQSWKEHAPTGQDGAIDEMQAELKRLIEEYRGASVQDGEKWREAHEEIKTFQAKVLDEIQPRLNNLQTDINSSMVGLEHVRHELAENTREQESLVQQIHQKHQESERQLEETVGQIQHLSPSVDERMANMRQEISALREYINAYENKADEQFEQAQGKLTGLQEMLDAFREETGLFQHKLVEEFKKENEDLSRRLFARSSGLESDLHREHEALKTMSEQNRQGMDKQLGFTREHISELKEQVNEVGQQMEDRKSEVELLKDELIVKEREIKESRNEIRLVNNQFGQFKSSQKRMWAAAVVAILLIPTLVLTLNSPQLNKSEMEPVMAVNDLPMDTESVTVMEDEFQAPDFKEETLAVDEGLFAPVDEPEDLFAEETPVENLPVTTVAFEKSAPEENGIPESKVVDYIVKKNDSLWKIAHKLYGKGIMAEKIKADNKLKNDSLKPGEVLRIYL